MTSWITPKWKLAKSNNDFNLRDSLETALKMLALRADEKGLELLCEIAPDVPEKVCGDPTRLRQIIVNLVGNAIKFTHHGEVQLKVALHSTEATQHTLLFTVADTGIGIPADKQKTIFDPFSQADSSTTRKYGGTGLGLSISARFIALMGGRIWVESELGKGAAFHFTVAFNVSEKQIEPRPAVSSEVLHGVKVLIVDDNHTNQRILQTMLSRWAMKPLAVESGEEALAALLAAERSSDPFALVLTDMHMPEMDGFSLIEHIRQVSTSSVATIVMLTSAGHRGDAERCKELGVAAYLLKPVRQAELRDALSMVLGARQHQEQLPLVTRFSVQGTPATHGALSLLVVEDNAVNQRLIVRMLEKRGHQVEVAGNGVEALQVLEHHAFDLVFMDIQMPEMDGLTATIRIREGERATKQHLGVVALTAHAMKGDQERCLAAGMDDYLSKPIRPQELDELLNRELLLRQSSSLTAHPSGIQPRKT
jgi:two-component system sensor histidine kinase/response regulator